MGRCGDGSKIQCDWIYQEVRVNLCRRQCGIGLRAEARVLGGPGSSESHLLHKIKCITKCTSWKSAIIEGAAVVLCPVEVLSCRQTQHQHKHMAHAQHMGLQHCEFRRASSVHLSDTSGGAGRKGQLAYEREERVKRVPRPVTKGHSYCT